MYKKIQLYIISLWFLFVLLVIETLEIPISFSPKAKFIGFKALIFENQISTFAIAFLILGGVYYFSFNGGITRGGDLLTQRNNSFGEY